MSFEERQLERERQIDSSLRHEEIDRCIKLAENCVSCKHNKVNTGEYFTCGATQCNKSNYPCKACAFLKWVNSGEFEDEIEAPPFPCELYEQFVGV
jgi:hypothetical protein